MFDEDAAKQTIAERNHLRRMANLPELDSKAELAKLRQLDADQRFETFCRSSPARDQVEAEVLALARQERNDPNWVPRRLLNGAMWYSLTVRERMRRLFYAENKSD